MSRSNPNQQLTNPCKRWFKWEGDKEKGYFSWYEKETKQTHKVESGFTFLVLDQLNAVTGYDNDQKMGFYSNEVRNLQKQSLIVRSKHGIESQGLWSQIKTQNKLFNFTKSVYVAFFDDNKELQIGNIKFTGSSLSGLSEDAIKADLEEAKINAKVKAKEQKLNPADVPLESYAANFLNSIGWINFSNAQGKALDNIAVIWSGTIEDKNGSISFLRPTFSAKTNISDETNQKAIELDRELQEYLTWYFDQPAVVVTEEFTGGEVATEPQIKLLYNLINTTGYLEFDICQEFGADGFEFLTKEQASLAIESQQKLVGELTASASI